MDARTASTIVIPAKNEARTVGDVVTEARCYASHVLVVDGHSDDGTAAIAERAGAAVLLDHGKGKGDAIRTALPHLHTMVTVFVDADGSHRVSDVPLLVDPILAGDADHVSASRLIGGSSELHGGFDEFFRLSGNAFITTCINRRFHVSLSDSQNGFRAIRTDVLHSLGLRENLTTIEQEMIIKTLRQGYRVAEVPSHELRRQYGTSHINPWRVAPRYAYSLLKYLLR